MLRRRELATKTKAAARAAAEKIAATSIGAAANNLHNLKPQS
jgi:hypothetical protein